MARASLALALAPQLNREAPQSHHDLEEFSDPPCHNHCSTWPCPEFSVPFSVLGWKSLQAPFSDCPVAGEPEAMPWLSLVLENGFSWETFICAFSLRIVWIYGLAQLC